MEVLKRIASFSVDHNKITEGIYLSRVDGDVSTYDLRTRVPNAGDYMDNVTMHSVEHLFAHRDIAEEVRALLKTEMENAVTLTVPLTVEISIGSTWYDAK